MKNIEKIICIALFALLLFLGALQVRVFLKVNALEKEVAAFQKKVSGQMKSPKAGEPVETKKTAETEAPAETAEAPEMKAAETKAAETEAAPETKEADLSGEAQLHPASVSAKGKKVAIDPGHQGSWVDTSDLEPIAPNSTEMKPRASAGTQGAYSGQYEYELNLGVSLKLRDELCARGYEVTMTREDNDANISNRERAQLATDAGADILVRIHANGSEDSSVSGALAMVPSQNNPYVGAMYPECYALGSEILNAYCAKTGFASQGVQHYDNMSGINWSAVPVTILEMGFMTNEGEDMQMADPSFWPQMAEGIADGIDNYFASES